LIAKKYGTSVSQLVQANNLGNTPVLTLGRSLIIPMSGLTPPNAAGGREAARESRSASGTARSLKDTAPRQSQTKALQVTSYTVRAGDTLAKIAARYHTTVEKLKSLNHLSSTRLLVGKRLVVSQPAVSTASNAPSNSPAGNKKVVHQVRQGETLNEIATTYKTSVDAILSWNESEDLSVIHPGDRITIFLGDDN
jgi:LysM repeat protein